MKHHERINAASQSAIGTTKNTDNVTMVYDGDRTSSLPAPTMQLTGHTGSIYALSYSPDGTNLCSASFDKTCLLWSHSDGYTNYNVLRGHRNAVLDCKWLSDGERVVTCGADKQCLLWDANTGQRLRKWVAHDGIVNAIDTTTEENTIVSASDDGTCMVWDTRQKSPVATLQNGLPVIAIAAAFSSSSSPRMYTGGIDNLVTCWDLREQRKLYSLQGHNDTITSLSLHPEGTHILSNSMDHTLKMWDVQEFVQKPDQRLVKSFHGHKHNAEKGLLKCSWNSSGSLVSAGSADRQVHVWDVRSGEELYLLPGHKGCVNTVVFHPHEHVLCSGASDKHVYVGELG